MEEKTENAFEANLTRLKMSSAQNRVL